MAVFKGVVEVVAADGAVIGTGMAYLHLPRGLERAQAANGTVSLRAWAPSEREPRTLRFVREGREVTIAVTREALSECSRNRILRVSAEWPGAA